MIQLDEETREKRGRDLSKLIRVDLQDRQQALQKRQVARNLYHNVKTSEPRYENGPNIHLPIIEEKVEGMVPKLVNAFLGAEPKVHVRRVAEEFNEDETDSNEKFLNWAVDADIPNFAMVIETWFRNMLLDGVSVLKVHWDRRSRNTVEICQHKREWQPGEIGFMGEQIEVPRDRTVLEVLAGQFPGLQSVSPDNKTLEKPVSESIGEKFEVTFHEDRRAYENIRVEIHESEYIDEVELYIYRPVMVANNPKVEVIEYEDIILPYRTWDLQCSPRITQRYWMRYAEFKKAADDNGWDIKDHEWDKIRNATKTEDRDEEDPEDRQLRRQRDAAVGEYPEAGKGGVEDELRPFVDGRLMMYEVYATEDLNDDGNFEEVVYTIPACLERIVDVRYLDELCPHGRRPFIDAHYVRVSDRWYSRSLGEQLTEINLEVDSIVNMVHEAQELINNPVFFYVPHANTVDPEVLTDLHPGMGIPVSDVNAVFFPKFPQEPLANLGAVDSMLLFADRLTIAPQAMGSNQTRNAPRTARGTLALLSESGIKTDIVITALQNHGWKELFQQIHALYAAFGDDSKWFHVTGENAPRRISRSEMRGRFNYSFSGNSVNTNREVLRSIAQVRYNTLVSNPLYSMDINAMRELTADFLRHFGEGVDVDKLLPKLPGQGGAHPPMDQQTENQIMASGQYVEVLPTDDHVAHIQEIERFVTSPRFEQLPQYAVSAIANHKRQHEAMLQQQVSQAGGPMPGGGGLANNVPTGMSNAQTQTDMNALEGGVM